MGMNRRTLVGAGLLAVAGVAGCRASPVAGGAGPGNGQTASPAITAASAAEATAAASPPAGTPSASPSGPGGIRNLRISSTGRSDLTAAFVAYKRIPPSDVRGPLRGSVYYAYDPATGTYWALARFAPASTSLNVQVSFQDGGAVAMYRKAGAGPWQVQTAGVPFVCGYLRFFPQAVLTAWSMPTARPAGVSC